MISLDSRREAVKQVQEVLADPQPLENEKIVFNAGDRCISIAMKSKDYLKLVSSRDVDITS